MLFKWNLKLQNNTIEIGRKKKWKSKVLNISNSFRFVHYFMKKCTNKKRNSCRTCELAIVSVARLLSIGGFFFFFFHFIKYSKYHFKKFRIALTPLFFFILRLISYSFWSSALSSSKFNLVKVPWSNIITNCENRERGKPQHFVCLWHNEYEPRPNDVKVIGPPKRIELM